MCHTDHARHFWVQRHMRVLLLTSLTCATLLSSAGCGGGESGGGGGDEPSAGVPIRGVERLGWNQAVNSLQQLRSLTFNLYVDSTRSSLSDVRCGDVAGQAGYDCSGRLPTLSSGQHFLELTSVLNGTESTRSALLLVNVTASSGLAPSAEQAQSDSSLDGTVVCVSGPGPGNRCFDVHVVATGLESVSDLSPTPDNRVLFVEGRQTVRIIEEGRLLPDKALAWDDGRHIVGLATDKAFDITRSVFLAWTEQARTGELQLNITRYRELQNVLGEAATIVSGLPFEGTFAPLAMDGDGLLYLALPALKGAESGVVLRFTRDGYTPQTNPARSLFLAEGYSQPTGLTVDARSGRIWLAGRHATWPDAISSLDPPSTGMSAAALRRPFRQTPRPPANTKSEAESPTIAVVDSPRSANTTLLVAHAGQLFRSEVAVNGKVAHLSEVRFPIGVEVLAATKDSNGVEYVVTGDRDGSASILSLQRQPR